AVARRASAPARRAEDPGTEARRLSCADAEPEARAANTRPECRGRARHRRRVPPRRPGPRAEPTGVGDGALHRVVRGPVRPVGADEAALEAVEVGLVDEVEEVQRGHGRVALDEADEVAVDDGL